MIRFGHRDTFYALKSIHLNQARNTILREELKNEVEILKTVDHPNIVTAVETFEWRNDLYLVLELCSGGDLYTRDPYTEPEAARISLSILNAVAYLHYRGISHRDLKVSIPRRKANNQQCS
jgi:serine/threonine protein kinase